MLLNYRESKILLTIYLYHVNLLLVVFSFGYSVLIVDKWSLLAHVLHSHYSAPNGFNFETDPPITKENVEEKSMQLLFDLLRKQEAYIVSGQLLQLAGDDFRLVVQFVSKQKKFFEIKSVFEETLLSCTH
jgi:hypothetical protein